MRRLLNRLLETWQRLAGAIGVAIRFLHRWAVLNREMEQGDGLARPPQLVQIKVTNRCNMRCKMCGQWGETGFHKEFEGRQTVDLDVARKFIDQVAPLKAHLTLWGGEPLVYPQLDELLEHAHRRKVPTGIITNGLTLAKHADSIVRNRVADLVVSLDAPPAIHDELRGVPGGFERTVEGLREVQRRRRQAGLARPTISISNVISEYTWEHLEEFYDLLAGLDVDIRHVVSTLRWWTDAETGAAYEEEMLRCFGKAAPSWTGFQVAPPLGIDTDKLNATLGRIRARRYPFKAFVHPHLTPEQLTVFFHNTSMAFGRNTCRAAWVYALMLPNGELTFCPDFPDYRIGSMAEDDFKTLWNGERARAFRRRMLDGLLPICPRCCGCYTTGTAWRPRKGSPRRTSRQ